VRFPPLCVADAGSKEIDRTRSATWFGRSGRSVPSFDAIVDAVQQNEKIKTKRGADEQPKRRLPHVAGPSDCRGTSGQAHGEINSAQSRRKKLPPVVAVEISRYERWPWNTESIFRISIFPNSISIPRHTHKYAALRRGKPAICVLKNYLVTGHKLIDFCHLLGPVGLPWGRKTAIDHPAQFGGA
jgi:hypothetical protein